VAQPTTDLFDIVRKMLHKMAAPPPSPDDYKKIMVAAAPVISYNPTTGAGFGFAGNLAWYMGTPETTNISSLVASVIATSKGQVHVNAKLDASTEDNRWRLLGDNRLYWTSQKTFGLGTQTMEADAVDQKYEYFRFFETFYREVYDHTYLGAEFLYSNHTSVEPNSEEAAAAFPTSPYILYSQQYGFDPVTQISAGAGVHALLDTRDGPITPTRGLYGHLSYQAFFGGFLGGTSSWQQLGYDARTYLRLSQDARHLLAFWTMGTFVTGGIAPYLDLPATAMDLYGRSGRGYPQGRFRGNDLVYGEVEYRWTVTRNGFFGVVGFLNTETLSNKPGGEGLFDSFASAGGAGMRFMLNKRSRTNLCLDYGVGRQGSSGVYLSVQEAF
jgi:hypothetical protein